MTTIYIDAAPLFAPVLLSIAAMLVASTVALAWLGWRNRRPQPRPARLRSLAAARVARTGPLSVPLT